MQFLFQVPENAATHLYTRSTPHPVTVTTRIITFLVGNPYKPSFATFCHCYWVGGRSNLYIYIYINQPSLFQDRNLKQLLAKSDGLVKTLVAKFFPQKGEGHIFLFFFGGGNYLGERVSGNAKDFFALEDVSFCGVYIDCFSVT